MIAKDHSDATDGKFLDYSDGRVINAGQIPPDLGLGGGYFKLSEAPNPQP